MNEKENVREISILDVLPALGKKWKMILCITLAALIVAGAAGAGLALLTNRSFGTVADFHVNSDGSNKYILSLVKSDRFAEAILMDENGLPAEFKGTDIYNEAFEAGKKIEDLEKELEDKQKELKAFDAPLTNLNKALTLAKTKYTETQELMRMLVESTGSADYKEQIEEYRAALKEAEASKDKAQKDYDDKALEKQEVELYILELNYEMEDTLEIREEALEAVMNKYRQIKENASKIEKIKKCVTYEYAEEENSDKQALLHVSISVPKDKEFAAFLLERISVKLPSFVEDNIESNATCEYISTFNTVDKLIASNPIIQAVKFGGIAAAVALVATCGIIVIVTVFTLEKKFREEESA